MSGTGSTHLTSLLKLQNSQALGFCDVHALNLKGTPWSPCVQFLPALPALWRAVPSTAVNAMGQSPPHLTSVSIFWAENAGLAFWAEKEEGGSENSTITLPPAPQHCRTMQHQGLTSQKLWVSPSLGYSLILPSYVTQWGLERTTHCLPSKLVERQA